ncbi:MAG: ABC transporter ATP-binding protein [Kiritimatiellae bacterium]|nr:ABC transporter ATP-binding protein [Kiritimatiellia bacterium]
MTAPPASPPAVRAEKLCKTFLDFWRRPRVEAVRGVDLEVPSGSVFALLGPNGSGKSTIVKMVLGLLFPTSGTLEVLGASPRSVEAKRRIGYLPEESRLYPQLTPRETLEFHARLFGLPRAVARRRIGELLAMTGLEHARDRAVGGFSKGMARRVGLAQALLNDPDLVLLDEPSSGLDPQGARQIKDLILALGARGKTVVLTSHLLADVEDVCSRIAIVFNGVLLAQGALDDLLERRDRTCLSFPTPEDPARLERAVGGVRRALGCEPEVMHPRQALEPYFLELVRRARTPGATGAVPSAPLAPYLAGGEKEKDP